MYLIWTRRGVFSYPGRCFAPALRLSVTQVCMNYGHSLEISVYLCDHNSALPEIWRESDHDIPESLCHGTYWGSEGSQRTWQCCQQALDRDSFLALAADSSCRLSCCDSGSSAAKQPGSSSPARVMRHRVSSDEEIVIAFKAANWVSFDFNVAYSSRWGYSLINTLKLKFQNASSLDRGHSAPLWACSACQMSVQAPVRLPRPLSPSLSRRRQASLHYAAYLGMRNNIGTVFWIKHPRRVDLNQSRRLI